MAHPSVRARSLELVQVLSRASPPQQVPGFLRARGSRGQRRCRASATRRRPEPPTAPTTAGSPACQATPATGLHHAQTAMNSRLAIQTYTERSSSGATVCAIHRRIRSARKDAVMQREQRKERYVQRNRTGRVPVACRRRRSSSGTQGRNTRAMRRTEVRRRRGRVARGARIGPRERARPTIIVTPCLPTGSPAWSSPASARLALRRRARILLASSEPRHQRVPRDHSVRCVVLSVPCSRIGARLSPSIKRCRSKARTATAAPIRNATRGRRCSA